MGWYDRSGKSLGPVGAPGAVLDPALSPDEKLIVFRRLTVTRERSMGARSEPWNGDAVHQRCIVQPSAVLVTKGRPHRVHIESKRRILKSLSKSRQRERARRAATAKQHQRPCHRNGRGTADSSSILRLIPRTNVIFGFFQRRAPRTIENQYLSSRTEFDELFGQLSPDSHWMAFTSDRSGRREVYVRPFPPGEGEWTISIAGGQGPRWRGDGKELFFEAADGKMMAVPVKRNRRSKAFF